MPEEVLEARGLDNFHRFGGNQLAPNWNVEDKDFEDDRNEIAAIEDIHQIDFHTNSEGVGSLLRVISSEYRKHLKSYVLDMSLM